MASMRTIEPLLPPKVFEAVAKLVRMRSGRPRDIARAFFVLGLSRPQIAKTEKCTLPYVRKVTERFAQAHQLYIDNPEATAPERPTRKPSILLTKRQFKDILPFFRTRGTTSVEIVHAFYVNGEAPSAIAKRHKCQVQHVAQTINRFSGALDLYTEAQRAAASAASTKATQAEAAALKDAKSSVRAEPTANRSVATKARLKRI